MVLPPELRFYVSWEGVARDHKQFGTIGKKRQLYGFWLVASPASLNPTK